MNRLSQMTEHALHLREWEEGRGTLQNVSEDNRRIEGVEKGLPESRQS